MPRTFEHIACILSAIGALIAVLLGVLMLFGIVPPYDDRTMKGIILIVFGVSIVVLLLSLEKLEALEWRTWYGDESYG